MKKRSILFLSISLVLFSGFLSGQDLQTPPRAQLTTITKLWGYMEQPVITRMEYGASPAIFDLGTAVNLVGGEPDNYLEILTGSDEYSNFFPELNSDAYGIWRCFDALGNLEWAVDTKSDEARTSIALADIDNDLSPELATGTTSGWCIEVMNKTGSWTPGVPDATWTFPYEPQRNGSFMWHSSPAIGDLISGPHHEGLEVVVGNNPLGSIWAFDGDNSDGVDDGITADLTNWGYPGPTGTEGVDWDVLWVFQTAGNIIASPTIGDINGDGANEVVCGSKDSILYCLNGSSGALLWSLKTGGMITSTAGIADFDNNGKLEIIVGSQDGLIYFIRGDLDNDGIINSSEYTTYVTGGPVLSSPSIADVNGDGLLEVLIGSDDWQLYCLHYNPQSNSVSLAWSFLTGNPVESSASIANSGRTNLTVYIGSSDSLLYILSGTGVLISSYKTNGPIVTSPAIADVNGDGKLEIAVTTWSAPDEFLLLRDDGSVVSPYYTPWPMFRHDATHTGFFNWSAPVLPTDVGVTDIIEPEDTYMAGSIVTPKAEVYNFGSNTATSFTVTFQIRNSSNTVVYSVSQTVNNLTSHTSRIVSFTPITTTQGHFNVLVSTALAGDLNTDNDMDNSGYQVVQPQWVLDFESDDAGFDASLFPNGWQWGNPTSGPMAAHSGSNVWATNLYGNYDNSSNWILDSHSFNAVQNNPVLSFWHWYDIENHRDGGNLKISINGGSWMSISPVDGYPGIATWNNIGIPDEPCYNGVSAGWKLTSFILPVTAGQQFLIRWQLGTDNIITKPGWYIDDVMGEGFVLAGTVMSTVKLTVLLEGLYNPVTHRMKKAQDDQGDMFPGFIADHVQVSLAEPVYPYTILHTFNDIDLLQDGSCTFSTSFIGNYYLVISHRNSIETWSSAPVTLVPGIVSYNFSLLETQAFGGNMKEMVDRWVLFGGDVNQDGLVDSGDMIPIDNLSSNFVSGYLPEDANGDGLIDSGDMIIVDNNASNFVGKMTP